MLKGQLRSNSYDPRAARDRLKRPRSSQSGSSTTNKSRYPLRELHKERLEYRSRSKTRGSATFEKYKELETKWNHLKTTLQTSRATTPSSRCTRHNQFSEDIKFASRRFSTAVVTAQRFQPATKSFAARYSELDSKGNSEELLKIAQELKRDLESDWLMGTIPTERSRGNSPASKPGKNGKSGKWEYFGKNTVLHQPSPGISRIYSRTTHVTSKTTVTKIHKKPMLNIKINKDPPKGKLLIQTCRELHNKTPINSGLAKTPISAAKNGTKYGSLTTRNQKNKFPLQRKKPASNALNYPNTDKKCRAFIETPSKVQAESKKLTRQHSTLSSVSTTKKKTVNKPERRRSVLKLNGRFGL